jgi:two-component system, NarL family, nitrate/nitrite response regulator NarL
VSASPLGLPKVRLLIADRAPTRLGVRMALGNDVVVCAEASDCSGATLAAERSQPDVCLVGSGIPGGGISAVRGIVEAAPLTAVIVLAETSDVDDLLSSVRAGAAGYIPGEVSAQRLRRVIDAVVANEAVVPRSMVLDLLEELRALGTETADGLTSRETQVLGLLRRGQSTASIAARLEIAPVTVRRHISELVNKLGVSGRAGLLQH